MISAYQRAIAFVLIVISFATATASVSQLTAQTLDSLSFDKKLKLAKIGDQAAQVAVGRAYEFGIDVNKSKLEAAQWYRKAAAQGNLEGQFRLARLVHGGGDGLQKSPEMAAKLYEATARQGHLEAQN